MSTTVRIQSFVLIQHLDECMSISQLSVYWWEQYLLYIAMYISMRVSMQSFCVFYTECMTSVSQPL